MPPENTVQAEGKPRRRSWRRLVRKVVIDAAIVYVVLLLAGVIFQKRLTYFPRRLDTSEQVPLLAGDEEVWIELAGVGRIHGIYHRAPVEGLTVLFLHGNSGNVCTWKGVYDGLVSLGAGVLMIDYPGYGKSEGSPCEEALYSSAHAAAEFLQSRGVPREDVVIFGKSIGTGVGVELASSGAFAGLVLESPFTSLVAAAQVHYWFFPVSLVFCEEYDSLSRIEQVGCPLLVVVATEDKLVPPEQSTELFNRAREPRVLLTIQGAGHNDIQDTGGFAYWAGLRDWLDKLR